MVASGQRPEPGSDPRVTGAHTMGEPRARSGPFRRLFGWILDLPPMRRPRQILGVYNDAGGGLLAEGLAYSALFAGLTGLLFCVGVLGYLVPAEADRQRQEPRNGAHGQPHLGSSRLRPG